MKAPKARQLFAAASAPPGWTRTRIVRSATGRFGLVLGLLLSVTWAPSATAHSMALKTEPGDGEVVAVAPVRLIVWFSQELESGPSGVQLLDQHGNAIDGIRGGLDLHDPEHKRLQADVPGPLAPGSYIVRWTAVSAEDGDRTQGEFRFEVRPASATE